MNTEFFAPKNEMQSHVWSVGALARAVADALDARLNPVTVRGEISGFMRASSGHCYFTIKDSEGQLRCAMFRRAATQLIFEPDEGDQVELRGRLGVYEPRGDLQLVVESVVRAGQGALYERFARMKALLQTEGLFEADRKRAIPPMPRGIGLVTSMGAAALHDVLIALARRAPHIPVILASALVQGSAAPQSIISALQKLYQYVSESATDDTENHPQVDVILVVRGGGSIEDLWAFNDEALVRCLAVSPVPVISGVGHETDFTLTDFVADLRAPTPTAAAELVSVPRTQLILELDSLTQQLNRAVRHRLNREGQRIDWLAGRIDRPSATTAQAQTHLAQQAERLRHALILRLQREALHLRQLAETLPRTVGPQLAAHRLLFSQLSERLPHALRHQQQSAHERLHWVESRLQMLDPRRVLERGYAWLQREDGQPLAHVAQVQPGMGIGATLNDGQLDLIVQRVRSLDLG